MAVLGSSELEAVQDSPIGIVGLGLIGGSLGLDLMAQGVEVRALVHRQSTAKRAQERELATLVSLDPAVLKGCALVVLALPLDRLLDPDPALLNALSAATAVTDVGSVKGPVLERWSSLHPRFVASHPMAGTTEAGVEAGQRGLFSGRPWVVTPDEHTDPTAMALVARLATRVGAQWHCCSADSHDRAVALISHLPVLVSAALIQGVDQAAAQWGDGMPELVRALASSGFADTSRVGGGNPELGTLMASSNRVAVSEALAAYRHSLERLEHHLESASWEELRAELGDSQRLRPEFL